MKKEPLTARIKPGLLRQLKAAAEQAGKSKTAILERALESYFEEGQEKERITGKGTGVSQETVNILRDVIRQAVGEALRDAMQNKTSDTNVMQNKPSDTNVIHGRSEPKNPTAKRIKEAQAIVQAVDEIREDQGLKIEDAAPKAGTSKTAYHRAKRLLKSELGHS